MSAPHPPPGPGEAPDPGNGLPAPSMPPSGGRRPSPAVIAAGAVVVAALAIAIGVAIARSGDGDGPSAPPRTTAPIATSPPTPTPSTTVTPPSTTTLAPDTTTSPVTAPAPTDPPVTDAETPPSTDAPADGIDLGGGVMLTVPDGWHPIDGSDPVTISDGVTWYAARVVQQDPADGPAAVVQDIVDAFDSEHTSVSYTPVRYRGTVSGALPADEYRLAYSAITDGGGRLSGAIHAFLRGDGLTLVVHAWDLTDAWPDQHEATDAVTDSTQRSLTDAPALGPAETLPIVTAFRVASVHPLVIAHGLAGFTVPPGFEPWTPVTQDGMTMAGAHNGATDLVAIAMPAPATVEDVFATVVDDLGERYPGLVVDTPSPQGTRDGVSRLGAGFAGTLDGRPIAGGVDAWLVGGDTAYAFAYTYYADISIDGSNPDRLATQFAYSAYANSF